MKTIWILHNDPNAVDQDAETRMLVRAFANQGMRSQVYYPKYFDIITSRRKPNSIRYQSNIISLPNAVLVRTGAGTNYFTLALLRQLEGFGIPVFNSSSSIANSKDKMISSQVLAQAKLPTPRTMLVSHPVDVSIVEQEIGFPCVVKLVISSKGKGIYLCKDRETFANLMDLTDNLKTKKTLIIQEFINSGELFDLRVWVIGGRACAVMKRTPPEGDFKANISRGGHGEQFALTEEIKTLAERTAKVFGLAITGIDLLYDGKRYLVCEANSSPGFEGIDKYCGTNMSVEIACWIKAHV